MSSATVKSIYLDNQATTPVDERVRACMLPYLTESYGNPHSNDHWFGWQAKKALDDSRKEVAALVKADPDEIIFTSGATEANNLAILGTLDWLKKSGRTKIIVSAFEHKCVLECAKHAQKLGFETIFLSPTRDGFIEPSSIVSLMDETVGLVSVMTVNNEIGTIQPVTEIAAMAHEVGAFFHTDAAQAGIFYPLDVSQIGADLLSLSAHKMYGPKGVGALYINRDLQDKISPLLHGGGQEGKLRSGTVPTMLCVGFGKACSLAQSERAQRITHLEKLSALFWDSLSRNHSGVAINGDPHRRHPGNLNIRFSGTDAHSLLQALQPNVAASTGSACTTGTPEPSYVLRALGLSYEDAASSIRFSFGMQNTPQEIEEAVHHILNALDSLEEKTAVNF